LVVNGSEAAMNTARSVVRRTAQLLRLLADHPTLTASDVSRRLGLPYATCHRLLETLREEALVDRDPAKRYRLAAGRLTGDAARCA
jgi:DNA-binding IclR family transcriptional regulator